MKLDRYEIAGKVFILGEYAVLVGLPSLVAAVPPRFTLEVSETPWIGHLGRQGADEASFHPDAPVSRLLRWAQAKHYPPLHLRFNDPLEGSGGLGASTAQFAMAALAYLKRYDEERASWLPVWRLYRELMQGEPLPPSGADLVAQWQGGVSFLDPAVDQQLDLESFFDWSCLLVFLTTKQPGRKVPTHEHLRHLVAQGFPQSKATFISRLKKIILDGILAVHENKVRELGRAMDETARLLQAEGLEAEATRLDREALRTFPGVCGVKGAGALQADILLVLMEGGSSVGDRERVKAEAKARGLLLLCDGLRPEKGVSSL